MKTFRIGRSAITGRFITIKEAVADKFHSVVVTLKRGSK